MKNTNMAHECPFCKSYDTKHVETVDTDELLNLTIEIRKCHKCGHTFDDFQ